MRLPRVLWAAAAVAALAFPPAPAQAVNTLAYTFKVDCANPVNTSTADVTLPSGRYLVTVAGACTFSNSADPASVPVDTCVHPLESLPCVRTGASVDNVPRAACMVGAGAAYAYPCAGTERGVWQPACGGWFTVLVNHQCLTTVPHHVGVVTHDGGSMVARVVDSTGFHYDNVGVFTVTAVWTPL